MNNKKLKRIMTDLAAGHITKKEAETLMKPKKMHQEAPKQEIKGKSKDHTQKEKIKSKDKKVLKKEEDLD